MFVMVFYALEAASISWVSSYSEPYPFWGLHSIGPLVSGNSHVQGLGCC